MQKLDKQLVLEDGSVYKGYGFGSDKESTGEVVFNTGMTGYQETFSDPSYFGQIVVFTYPLIGNYGVNRDDYETIKPSIRGIVVREYCKKPSNFRKEFSIDEVLKNLDIPGISGVDTRSLTKKIRQFGTIKGKIVNIEKDPKEVIKELKTTNLEQNQIEQVSIKSTFVFSGTGHSVNLNNNHENNKDMQTENNYRVVLIDCGAKSGIIRELNKNGFDIVIMSFDSSAKEILNQKPDGVVISNGPGNPESVPKTIETIKELTPKVPIFGICMGHQLIALANGGKTYKLKYGHRGLNQPVKNKLTNKVYITSQNHGYAVDSKSLDNTDLEVTHFCVNDNTCEGLRHKKYPVFSVQYHPESTPGPNDSKYLFDEFKKNMEEFRKNSTKEQKCQQ